MVVAGFVLASLVTLVAGVFLEQTGNELADDLGMNGVVFGATILAAVTARHLRRECRPADLLPPGGHPRRSSSARHREQRVALARGAGGGGDRHLRLRTLGEAGPQAVRSRARLARRARDLHNRGVTSHRGAGLS